MNKTKLEFAEKVPTILYTASQISEVHGMKCVNEISVFSALASVSSTNYHSYLVRREVEDIKIKENVEKLISIYANRQLTERNLISIQILNTKKQKAEYVDIKLAESLWLKFKNIAVEKKSEIFKSEENAETEKFCVTEDDILKLIILDFSDIYENFMNLCFPSKVIINEYDLPQDLRQFLTVMNNKFSIEDVICPILERESELKQLIKILSKSKKRNAVLVGEPGVGKTAIVEKLAWSIATNNCHESFSNVIILSLDVNSVIAGTKYRGMAEERFKGLIEFLEQHQNCVLFIDEIHTILGAGACVDGELDLANALKPILARGDTRVIGATTSEEYKKYFSKDGALQRRFEAIEVKEPHFDKVYPMIKNQIYYLEKFHNVSISRELVDFAILNAACFNYETKNPDRTLDLIDRSMAGSVLNGNKVVQKSDILDNYEIYEEMFKNDTKKQRIRIAFHEAGHYIVQRYSTELTNRRTIAISIMPAKNYYGVNVLEEVDNVVTPDDYDYYIQLIGALLGGRFAEQIHTGKLSAGARQDLIQANKIAENMVTQCGIFRTNTSEADSTERIYILQENGFCSEEIKNKKDKQIIEILNEAKEYAMNILTQHSKELRIIAAALLEYKVINENDIDNLLKDYPQN